MHPVRPRATGTVLETVAGQHEHIKAWLDEGLTLTKMHTLLGRRGVMVSYRTPAPLRDNGIGVRSPSGDGAGRRW